MERSLTGSTRRRVLSGVAALSVAAALPSESSGQGWRPEKTIRIVVPVAPGGSTDLVARLLATHLKSAWGQPAIVENRPGGGGTIGTLEVIKQSGDACTILIGNPGPTAIAYSVFRNLPYRPDQLQPVSSLFRIPNIVSAHPSIGIRTIPDLIGLVRAQPGRFQYGSSGLGQTPHLTAAWFLQLTGLNMLHVPYRGAGPALQAALAGEVHVLFDNLYPSLPQIQDARLVGLAVTTMERSMLAPELPTLRESAPELAEFDMSSWCGVFLPQGVPQAAIGALNLEIKAMLEREDVKQSIAGIGARVDYGTPQQFKDFVVAEIAKFAAIAGREGLQMDVN